VDSPLAAFLAHPETRRRDGIAMAVIAGDTEFSGLGLNNLGRRVANLFCDWRLFDDYDNDLVVDTDSMYAGLGFQAGTGYLYDQGEAVTHFRYFFNPSTRDAVHAWLADDPARLERFEILAAGDQAPWEARDRRVERGGERQPRPVVILLPGIMGSHIAVHDKDPKDIDRIWFQLFRLGFGQLSRIADIADPQIFAEDIWERIYGDLADYLGETHDVVRCPYDWRQPVGLCADALHERIASALHDNPGQPIRLLAHSMGGLVARCLMQKYPEDWQAVVASGGRLVMLGTPNNGAHLMVHTLLGKTSSMRGLEKLDTQHSLQEVLDIVGGFPGALTLLPRPAWKDVGSDPRLPTAQYYLADTWQDLRNCNTDRWYGDHIGALPSAEFLGLAKAFWEFLPRNEVPDPDRVCYVYGQGEKTPCGVVKTADGRLQLLFTSEGDGSVTWVSGRLDNIPDDERGWYMPIEHGDLASVEDHFPAILDLITRGTTDQLDRLPQTRGAAAATFVLDAPPPVIPSEDELARALIGSAPRRRQRPPKAGLAVSVLAGDLRFVDQPVICGHYIGDPIAAAEAILDKELDGRLSERERLGVYAGEIGTAAIVLPPRSAGQSLRDSRPGAIIVGLGDFNGQLGAQQISETVRTAVLRLLLLLRDTSALGNETPIRLYSLLLGGNSTTHISVDESVAAVTCGVLEANNQFAQVVANSEFPGNPVATLTFIDIYRDVAITAAHAVAELPRTLASQLRALNAELDVARSLEIGKGVRERLAARSGQGYWSRLIITDADASDSNPPPESNEAAGRSPVATAHPASGADGAGSPPAEAAPGDTRYLPERLKYVFLSQRARAETLVQQRQPGLIEAIIRKQRLTNTPNPQLGQTLFQLMVPVAYKSAARESPRLLLILDSYTASLPWELLQADDEPLAVRSPMVRQLITARFRGMVPSANSNSACIIVAPSTYGYHRRFGGKTEALPELPGAIREGEAIRDKLREARWSNIVCGADGREAIDVLADLYHAPYRLLAICGHGIFEARGVDGRSYSGVVLTDGLLITAVEIGLMEVVPEVVFLSCCHLGSMSHEAAQPNRLAYSLARELIDIGVRCVVAAGWAVDDAAAETFATVFFDKLTTGDTFGDAVFAARVATYDQHRATNTWGAYQAYGDPAYRLGPPDGRRAESNHRYMAVEELLDQLENRRISHATREGRQAPTSFATDAAWVRRELARCPPEWARRPEVLQALGRLYAEFGDAGFQAAREAYLAALQSDDAAGRVGCQVIEQLANLEARCGQKLIDQGRPADGLALLDTAARRLLALDTAVDGQPALRNPERAALLGSTLKRQAAAQAQLGKPGWKAIAATLEAAAAAYRKAGGESAADSYNTLNALAFAWLAGALPIPPEEGAELARRCGAEASRRFAGSKSFWDAVGAPDAAVVAWLLSGQTADPDEQLRTAYRQLAREVPHTAREWDSVATQLQLLARFLELRQQAGDAERAALLKQLADPETPPPSAGQPKGRRRAPARKKAG
ncbi:MAG TPA: CHAT domain-containing protein, partial [Azonexus sp.]|nr:CHAT domain-containing protein [Azonexus sp.]